MNRIYILVCLIIFSVTNVHGIERTDSLYKVLKIKVTGDYYVIHAQRNDSLFKIISKRESLDSIRNLQLLKTGQCYYFDFRRGENGVNNEAEPLTGIMNNLDIKNDNFFTDGHTRIKFSKRFHYRLYTTKNLIGLYYSPSSP